MVLSVTTGNTFSMPFFDIFPLPKIKFLQGEAKVLLLSSSPPGGWLSERVEKLFLSPVFFPWFERPNVAPHATLSVAPPHSRVPFFRGSLAADTVILPCFRFRKEILGSAVEGTSKGVQKRYARLSNLLCGLSCHQLCFRFSPAKHTFIAQLINAHGEVNSPVASTLFVLDRSDI